MLGKLFKHEFIATGRYFLPLYIFVIILTPIFSLIMRISDFAEKENALGFTMMYGLSMTGFIIMMIAIFIGTTILIILRYYKTTATSEAYLTFTLPVKTYQIILAKTLTAYIWEIVSGIIAFMSIFSMMLITGVLKLSDIRDMVYFITTNFTSFTDYLSMGSMLLIIISILLGGLQGILRIYFSISIGQLFRNHRVLISIAAYFALYTILQVIGSVFMLPMLFADTTALSDAAMTKFSMNYSFIFSSIESIAIIVLCFLGTTYINKKHLNVQ